MINRICDTFRNSFDSLIISSFIGLTATAIYGNYYYIYSALYGIMLVIANAMSASVGNAIIKKTQKENYGDMLAISQIYMAIINCCTILLACLYQPFMRIWAGEDLMLPIYDMLLFCVYFYVINLNSIRNQYISGTGIWWKLKATYIIEAVANLLLNVFLGKFFGITGVILATIITIFTFNYIQRNTILFKNYFKNQSLTLFYREQLYYTLLLIIGFTLSYFVCEILPIEGSVAVIIVRTIVCLMISNLVYYFGVKNTKRFKESKKLLVSIKKTVFVRKNRHS